ncbi:Hypothetical_protein [Hexamita inflata]|uniref:Hypothetical_protein n=1 Tax=Hexamita inflata TaxID=28002 RepID=A0AA86U6W5_9EUKA|nr:Hypothetical protein HINF_LOCUS32805 [Hexamita inflata]
MNCYSSYTSCFSNCYDHDCEFSDYYGQFCCFNATGLQWWVWLLIAIAIVVFISIVACIIRCCCCKKQKYTQIIAVEVQKSQQTQHLPTPQYVQPYVPVFQEQQQAYQPAPQYSQNAPQFGQQGSTQITQPPLF